MANGGETPNLWDADHKDGQELVSLSPTYHQLLMGNFMALLGKLEFSQHFWTHLLDRGVVDKIMKTKIQAANTRESQVLKLVDRIVDSEVYKFHGFAWAIVNSQQYKLAEELGFDLKVYLDESHFLKTSSFTCPACREYNTKSYILPQCGHFVCSPCVKGAQFICKNNKKEDIQCPVPECEKISESHPNSESAIGLKEDATYANLCKLVQGQAQVEKDCKDNGNETKTTLIKSLNNSLKRRGGEISTYESKYRRYTDTLASSDQRLRNYVKETSKRLVKWADDWRVEQEEFIDHAKIEVKTHHAEGVQWEKAIGDLTIMSNVYPWKLEKIASELTEGAFPQLSGATPEVVSYVEQQLSGTAIPKKILIPRHLDTHATAGLPLTRDRATHILEWKSVDGNISDLDWTLDGHIILATHDQQVIRLALDVVSRSVKMHKLNNINSNTVSTSKEGRIYLSHNDKLDIYNPSIMNWEAWNITHASVPVEVISVVGNAKYVLVSYDGKITTFDYTRKYQAQINVPNVKKTCICKNTLVVAAKGIYLINLETMVPQAPKTLLGSPSDVAPFGDGHFLVYDKLFKVFSLTGKFVHSLVIDKEIHKPQKSHCKRHVSIATYPKDGTPSRLAVACCSELRVYYLT